MPKLMSPCAQVAKLVDALASGASLSNEVKVRVLSWAPNLPLTSRCWSMKFLCLGYLDMDKFDAAPEAVKSEILAKCGPMCLPFRATGHVIFEEGVQHHSEAVSIRAPGRIERETFIKSASQIGSVIVIEAENMDAAIEVALLHPGAQLGEEFGFGMEIRPLQ